MHRPNPFSSATLHHVASLISQSPLRRIFPAVLLALGMITLLSTARAVEPPPDGGYPNENTAEGDGALQSLTTGPGNTAIGFDALFSNTTGNQNTAAGDGALFNNTTGGSNTGIGDLALINNTTGSDNTACGGTALANNSTGSQNTAVGVDALLNNNNGWNNAATGAFALQSNRGDNNTANGAWALTSNTTASQNTANGAFALFSNTTGYRNTANGMQALYHDTIGTANTATGVQALFSNTTGTSNTATGGSALIQNTTGSFNTADGLNALFDNTTGINNTASGSAALASNTTGSGNIAIGRQAGVNLTTGNNNIDIGSAGVAGEANKIRIGKTGTQTATFIAGIRGVTVASGLGVVVSSNGQLGTLTSSARFKEAIKPMDKASEAILALKPVMFRYKQELDPDGVPQFGLVAEQVEKVNPDLVARDADGRVNTVRYEAVNAMLLNEFLKEHRKVQELEKDLRSTIAQQQKQIEALTATVQKVRDKMELGKSGPQLVANRR